MREIRALLRSAWLTETSYRTNMLFSLGSLLFMVWPFFAHSKELGALAWIGGIIALAVYFMTLRKTSGGIAYDFLQRLAKTQRSRVAAVES